MDMRLKTSSAIIIFGVSSFIGQALAKSFIGKFSHLYGTYRTWGDNLDELQSLARNSGTTLSLFKLDVLDDSNLDSICSKLISSISKYENICILYCCGVWYSNQINNVTLKDFDKTLFIGLRAPYYIVSRFSVIDNINIIILTGLGGERCATRGNSVYCITTNGIYTLVRSVGEEFAGKNKICCCVSISLFDKGQKYIKSLCKGTGLRLPIDYSEVLNLVIFLVFESSRLYNGSILEASGGLFNYSETVGFFENIDSNRKDKTSC